MLFAAFSDWIFPAVMSGLFVVGLLLALNFGKIFLLGVGLVHRKKQPFLYFVGLFLYLVAAVSMGYVGYSINREAPRPIPQEVVQTKVVSDQRKGDELLLRIRNESPKFSKLAIFLHQGQRVWSFRRAMVPQEDATLYLPIPGQDPAAPVTWVFRPESALTSAELAALKLPRTQDIHNVGEEK